VGEGVIEEREWGTPVCKRKNPAPDTKKKKGEKRGTRQGKNQGITGLGNKKTQTKNNPKRQKKKPY